MDWIKKEYKRAFWSILTCSLIVALLLPGPYFLELVATLFWTYFFFSLVIGGKIIWCTISRRQR